MAVTFTYSNNLFEQLKDVLLFCLLVWSTSVNIIKKFFVRILGQLSSKNSNFLIRTYTSTRDDLGFMKSRGSNGMERLKRT